MVITRFTEIRAWQSARQIAKTVYAMSDEGVLAKDFAFRDQLRRAVISIMNNIAEGFGRRSDADFLRFLDMARGSACEVQSLCFLGQDVGRMTPEQSHAVLETTEKVIGQIAIFQKYLRSSSVGESTAEYEV